VLIYMYVLQLRTVTNCMGNIQRTQRIGRNAMNATNGTDATTDEAIKRPPL